MISQIVFKASAHVRNILFVYKNVNISENIKLLGKY